MCVCVCMLLLVRSTRAVFRLLSLLPFLYPIIPICGACMLRTCMWHECVCVCARVQTYNTHVVWNDVQHTPCMNNKMELILFYFFFFEFWYIKSAYATHIFGFRKKKQNIINVYSDSIFFFCGYIFINREYSCIMRIVFRVCHISLLLLWILPLFFTLAHTRIGDRMIYYNMRVHKPTHTQWYYEGNNNGFVMYILSILSTAHMFASMSMSTNLLLPWLYFPCETIGNFMYYVELRLKYAFFYSLCFAQYIWFASTIGNFRCEELSLVLKSKLMQKKNDQSDCVIWTVWLGLNCRMIIFI